MIKKKWIFACAALAMIMCGCSQNNQKEQKKNEAENKVETKPTKPSSPFGKVSPDSKEVEIMVSAPGFEKVSKT